MHASRRGLILSRRKLSAGGGSPRVEVAAGLILKIIFVARRTEQ